MAGLRWKRALAAGTALSIVMAAISVTSADDGSEVEAFIKTLVLCLALTGIVTLVGWWLQGRSVR